MQTYAGPVRSTAGMSPKSYLLPWFVPMAQKRREQKIWEQMKNARDATEAKGMADAAHEPTKLPENWNDSYRSWQRKE